MVLVRVMERCKYTNYLHPVKRYAITVKRTDMKSPLVYTVIAAGPDAATAMVLDQMYPPHRPRTEILEVKEIEGSA